MKTDYRTLLLILVTMMSMVIVYSVRAEASKPVPGKALYEKYCAFCHGKDGRADTPVGRILKPHPRRFADPVEMARLTDDQIHRAIKQGIPGTAMASWGQILTEPQIGDVMDYIRSLVVAGGTHSTPEQISLEVGRRIYDMECAFCHGLKGHADTDAARVLKPPPRKFADPIEMARVDDGRMYAAIKLGVSGTAMASWGDRLSPVEIIDVMRYIRSLEQPLPAGMTRKKLDILVGGNIYRQYCVTCHGEKGDAKTPLGSVLVPHPRNFTNARVMARISDKRMTQSIMNGRSGTAMAPWGGILNPEDIRRVILYIRHTFQHQH